jgi:hypothetical protein
MPEGDHPLDAPRQPPRDEGCCLDGRAAPAVRQYQARLHEGLRFRCRGGFPQAAAQHKPDPEPDEERRDRVAADQAGEVS